jgi:hypothetical protein
VDYKPNAKSARPIQQLMIYALALTRRKRFQTVLFVGREQLP